MHAYLTRIGVPAKVQSYFAPYFQCDVNGDLRFSYGDAIELYGLGFHRVPQSEGLWIAGESDNTNIRQVVIGHSAMDAIAFLALHAHTFQNLSNILFVATGAGVAAAQLSLILENWPKSSYVLIFENDLLGRVADLKTAAGIRRVPVAVKLLNDMYLEICYRYQQFYFDGNSFSLSRFERSSGRRFGIRTYKARHGLSFIEELIHHHLKI